MYEELLDEPVEPEYEELLDVLVAEDPRTDEDLDAEEARETPCAPLVPMPENELPALELTPRDAEAADETAERVEAFLVTEPLLTAVLAPAEVVDLKGLVETP